MLLQLFIILYPVQNKNAPDLCIKTGFTRGYLVASYLEQGR